MYGRKVHVHGEMAKHETHVPQVRRRCTAAWRTTGAGGVGVGWLGEGVGALCAVWTARWLGMTSMCCRRVWVRWGGDRVLLCAEHETHVPQVQVGACLLYPQQHALHPPTRLQHASQDPDPIEFAAVAHRKQALPPAQHPAARAPGPHQFCRGSTRGDPRRSIGRLGGRRWVGGGDNSLASASSAAAAA